MATNIPGFKGLKICIQFLANHPHKPIFYTFCSYDVSNAIILTWSGNKFEHYTTQHWLECYQYADHDRIINIILSVSGIINTLLGVAVFWKV